MTTVKAVSPSIHTHMPLCVQAKTRCVCEGNIALQQNKLHYSQIMNAVLFFIAIYATKLGIILYITILTDIKMQKK